MSNFTDEEIKRLQQGGNGTAKDLWLARWSPDTYALPNPGEEKRILRFMKLCFEKQAWKKDEGGRTGASSVSSASTVAGAGGNASVGRTEQKPPVFGIPHEKGTQPVIDDWGEDPFEPKKSVPISTSVTAQPGQGTSGSQHPHPSSSFNLLGDPVPIPSLIPALDPATPQTQPSIQPPSTATDQKALWELFGGQTGAPTPTPTQLQHTGTGSLHPVQTPQVQSQAQASLEQQRLQLQRQQEEFARQQQLFQQQQVLLQQQMQHMRLQGGYPPGQPGIPYGAQVYGAGQPTFVPQPFGQPTFPPPANNGAPAKDPFSGLNWG